VVSEPWCRGGGCVVNGKVEVVRAARSREVVWGRQMQGVVCKLQCKYKKVAAVVECSKVGKEVQ